MARYYVNNQAQSNGDHEVHREDCHLLPADRQDLGEHASCAAAVAKAQRIYANADGCRSCSPDCHTS